MINVASSPFVVAAGVRAPRKQKKLNPERGRDPRGGERDTHTERGIEREDLPTEGYSRRAIVVIASFARMVSKFAKQTKRRRGGPVGREQGWPRRKRGGSNAVLRATQETPKQLGKRRRRSKPRYGYDLAKKTFARPPKFAIFAAQEHSWVTLWYNEGAVEWCAFGAWIRAIYNKTNDKRNGDGMGDEA
ncbi:hypothetical protein EI94DRAFT_1704241 [Lactarius quietus]|nr:hypothetical protein EI94DRAFT_1704241 [Lactarius quietus]